MQYVLPPALAVVLIAYLYRDTSFAEIQKQFQRADLTLTLLSAIPWLISHWARAVRWQILLKPAGFRPSISGAYFSILTGYLANLLLPRLGEISRCALLRKTDGVEMDRALGTVVVDRTFDLVMLALITAFGFLIEYDVLSGFLKPLLLDKASGGGSLWPYLLAIFTLGLLILFLLLKFRHEIAANPLGKKVLDILMGIFNGIMSVRRIKEKWTFLLLTIVIWAGYFFATWMEMLALPLTGHLGWNVGYAILILGSFGMAAPVQGGIGPYHYMVAGGFLLYGLKDEAANIAAAFLHSIPTLFMIVFGAIGLIAGLIKARRREADRRADQEA